MISCALAILHFLLLQEAILHLDLPSQRRRVYLVEPVQGLRPQLGLGNLFSLLSVLDYLPSVHVSGYTPHT